VCCCAGSECARGGGGGVDPDAQRVLTAMSNYLGALKSFSVEYSAVDEIVQGQRMKDLGPIYRT